MPTTYEITLQASGGKIKKFLYGQEFSGDLPNALDPGDQVNFVYARPFALFLTKYVGFSVSRGKGRISAGRARFPSPFTPAGLLHTPTNGAIRLTVRNRPDSGAYTYVLALNDGQGGVATEDPQIIVR